MNDKEYELLEYVFQLAYSSAYTEEIKEISDLEDKIIKKLKNEDKAIEYINGICRTIFCDIEYDNAMELLDILKGIDKE